MTARRAFWVENGHNGHQLPESAIMAALEDGTASYKRIPFGVRHDVVVLADGREFWRYS